MGKIAALDHQSLISIFWSNRQSAYSLRRGKFDQFIRETGRKPIQTQHPCPVYKENQTRKTIRHSFQGETGENHTPGHTTYSNKVWSAAE
jgi:hypothetical protein